MHKAMISFVVLASLTLAAMENGENIQEKELDDDAYASLTETEQQKFQVKLWLLQNQKVPLERIKLHRDTTQEIKEWAHQEINNKKEKNSQQYMSIQTFEETNNYKSIRCTFEGKQWNKQAGQCESTGISETRYLVRDLDYDAVYKKRLKLAELPLCLQKAIKYGRAQAIEKNKFFYGDFGIPDSKNKIKVYANKDMLDIYTEELSKFYNFDLSLREERYIAMNYAAKFLQGLPDDTEEYEEFIIVVADEQEESYICKTGRQYYLFGVLFNQDVPDKDGVYSIEINDTVYKLADRLLDLDQTILDKMGYQEKPPLDNSSSEEISSESTDEEEVVYEKL